jgi:hypothetical protein
MQRNCHQRILFGLSLDPPVSANSLKNQPEPQRYFAFGLFANLILVFWLFQDRKRVWRSGVNHPNPFGMPEVTVGLFPCTLFVA